MFAEAPNLEVTNAAGTCHSLCFLLLLLPKLLLPLHQGSGSDTPGGGYPAQQPHLGTRLRVWKGGTTPPERHYCKSLLVSAAFRRGTHFLGCAAAPAEPLLRPVVPQLTGAHGPSGDVPRPAGPLPGIAAATRPALKVVGCIIAYSVLPYFICRLVLYPGYFLRFQMWDQVFSVNVLGECEHKWEKGFTVSFCLKSYKAFNCSVL